MAGTITTVIRALFKSEGADKVAQDINKVGKAGEDVSKKQTRLGNESTNTGRAFSAQASGLGGLVAAYAGAAATTFALQQSFSALSAAARSEALVAGVNSLAQSVGQNGPNIVQSIKAITRGQLSIAESAQNAGIALSAGLGGEQIEQLTDIATRASKALGRDLTDSIQRLVRGVGKLEPELLDELGIFTRIEPAVERYAAKVGKAVSSLTNFERRQAFANAVIEEGSIKYRNVDTTISDSSQNLNRLAANLQDLALKLGQVLTTILNPLVDFFNKDVAGLAGLAATIGALIFSKLNQVSKEAIGGFTKSIQSFAATTTNWLSALPGGFGSFEKSVASAEDKLDKFNKRLLVGSKDIKKQTKDALTALSEGPKPGDIAGIRSALAAQITEQEKAIATRQAKIARLEVSSTKDKSKEPENTVKINELKKKNEKTIEATQQLVNANAELGNSFSGIGKVAAVAGGGVRFFGTAVSLAGRALGGLLSLFSRGFVIFSIVDVFLSLASVIFGFENPLNNLIDNLAKFFDRLFEGSRRSRQTLEALASSFIKVTDTVKNLKLNPEDLAKAQENAKTAVQFAINPEQLRVSSGSQAAPEAFEEFKRRAADITKTVDEQIKIDTAEAEQRILDANRRSTGSQVNTGILGGLGNLFDRGLSTALGAQGPRQRVAEFEAVKEQIEAQRKAYQEAGEAAKKTQLDIAAAARDRAYQEATTNKVLEQSRRLFAVKIEEIDKQIASSTDQREINRLLAEKEFVRNAGDLYEKYLQGILNSSGKLTPEIVATALRAKTAIAKGLSLSPTDAEDIFTKGIVKVIGDNKVSITAKDIFGQDVLKFPTIDTKDLDNLDTFSKAVITSAIAVDKMRTALESGSVSSDVLDNQLLVLKQSLKDINSGLVNFEAAIEMQPLVKSLEEAISRFTKLRDTIALTELNLKDLKEAFSGSIQASSALIRSGAVSIGGNIAVTSDQQKTNQLAFLASVIRSTDTIKELETKQKKNKEEIVRLTALYNEETIGGRTPTEATARALGAAQENATLLQNNIDESRNGLKAITGEAIPFVRQMKELADTETRRTQELQNQVAQLTMQNELARLQQDLETTTLRQRLALDSQRLQNEINAINKQAGISAIDLEKARKESTVSRLESEKQALQVQQEFRDVVAETIKLQISARTQNALIPLQQQKTLLEQFQGFGGEDVQRELQFQIDTTKLRDELSKTVTDLNKVMSDSAVKQAEKDLAIAQERKSIADTELKAVNARGAAEAARINAEAAIREQERKDRADNLKEQEKIAIAQARATILQVDAQVKIQELEFKNLEERAKQIKAQAEIFKKFLEGILEVFSKDQAIRAVQLENPSLSVNSPEFTNKVVEATKTFKTGLEGAIAIGNNYTIDLSAQRALLVNIADLQRRAATDTLKGILERVDLETKNLDEQKTKLEELRKAQLNLAGTQLAADRERAKAAIKAAEVEVENAKSRVKTAELSRENAKDELEQKKKQLIEELKFAERLKLLQDNKFFQLLNDSLLILKKSFSELALTLLTDVINGVKTVKQAFVDFGLSLAKEIQKAVATRLVVEPIIGVLDKTLFQPLLKSAAAFFVPNTPMASEYEKRLNDPNLNPAQVASALTNVGGLPALRVTMVGAEGASSSGAAGGATPDQASGPVTPGVVKAAEQTQGFGDKLKDLGVNFQTVGTIAATTFVSVLAATRDWKKAFIYTVVSALGTALTQIAMKSMFSGAAGAASGAGAGLFSGFGDWFKGLFGGSGGPTPVSQVTYFPGAEPVFTPAIGGLVRHMAAGGYAGLRDRVPALLEPGEFVIRRPAAMAIGGQTLNQMNATGQSGTGNVTVNVNNQGTAQETVGTPKISMNGTNMIVDIVVRDIQNNGPIRKTLRGM